MKLGDIVRLNSGGPSMMVVDFNDDMFICSYKDKGVVVECEFKRPCIHRIKDAW